MSATDKYLEFLDRLFKRRMAETQSAGFSIWILCSASIYLFWRILPIIFTRTETHFLNNFAELYIALYNLFLPLFIIYAHYSNSLDRRRHFITVRVTNIAQQTLLSFLFLIPPFIGTFFLNLSEIDQRIFNASFFLMLGIFLLSLYAVNITNKRWKQTGYLPVRAIKRKLENTKIGIILEIIVNLFFLVPSALSLFLFLHSEYLFAFNHDVLKDLIDLIVSTAVLNTLLLLLVSKFLEKHSVNAVNQLKRDIVLYDISEEEIRKRIEHEVLFETPLGAWINERLGLIQGKREAVFKLSQDSYDLKLNVGDAKKHHSDLLVAYISYAEEVQNMVKWLLEAQSDLRFHKDMFLSKIVDETVNDLRIQSAETQTLFNAAVDHFKKGAGLTIGGA